MNIKKFVTLTISTLLFTFCNSAFAQKSDATVSTFNLQNTRWEIKYSIHGYDDRDFDMIFHADGWLENFHPSDNSEHDDTWIQKGNKVIITLNNKYTIYKGEIIDHDTIVGKAKSKRGLKWEWKATRKNNLT